MDAPVWAYVLLGGFFLVEFVSSIASKKVARILSIFVSVATIVCNLLFAKEKLWIPSILFGISNLALFGKSLKKIDWSTAKTTLDAEGDGFRVSHRVSTDLLPNIGACIITGVVFYFWGREWTPVIYIAPVVSIVVNALLIKFSDPGKDKYEGDYFDDKDNMFNGFWDDED